MFQRDVHPTSGTRIAGEVFVNKCIFCNVVDWSIIVITYIYSSRWINF